VHYTYKDSKGFVWFAALDAVNRWDGCFMKVYNAESQFKNCPVLTFAYNFVEDQNANIYMGSSKGLYCYQRKTNQFILISLFPKNQSQEVIPFAFKDNKIWAINKDYHIISYDVLTSEKKYFKDIKLNPIKSFNIYQITGYDYFIRRIPFFIGDDVYLADYETLVQYNYKTKAIHYYKPDEKNAFNSLFYDKEEQKILIGNSNAYFEFSLFNKQFKKITLLDNYPLKNINFPFKISKNLLFLWGSHDYKVYNTKTQKIASIFSPYFKMEDFDSTYPLRNSSIWINNSKLNFIPFPFQTTILPQIQFATSTTNSLLSIASLDENNLLIATSLGLYTYKIQTKEFRRFSQDNIVYRIAEDSIQNGIWLFSIDETHSILFYDKASRKTHKILSQDIGSVQDIASISQNFTLISSTLGLYVWNKTTQTLVQYQNHNFHNAFKINVLYPFKIALSYTDNRMDIISFNKQAEIISLQSILQNNTTFML